jgi:hypothetical protein
MGGGEAGGGVIDIRMLLCYDLNEVNVMETKTNLKRTTIFLTEEQHEQLRRIAFEKKTSMANLLREAFVEMLENEEDIRDCLKTWDDTEGEMTLDEYRRTLKK